MASQYDYNNRGGAPVFVHEPAPQYPHGTPHSDPYGQAHYGEPPPSQQPPKRGVLPFLRRAVRGKGRTALAALLLAFVTRPQEYTMRQYMLNEVGRVLHSAEARHAGVYDHRAAVALVSRMEFGSMGLFTFGLTVDEDTWEGLACIGVFGRWYPVFDDSDVIHELLVDQRELEQLAGGWQGGEAGMAGGPWGGLGGGNSSGGGGGVSAASPTTVSVHMPLAALPRLASTGTKVTRRSAVAVFDDLKSRWFTTRRKQTPAGDG